MGTHVLVLVLGCWVLGLCGASGSRPQLKALKPQWVPAGDPLELQCWGSGSLFFLLLRGRPTPLQNVTSRSGFVIFAHRADTGSYTCRCQDPPGPLSPHSNPVEVVVTARHLAAPRLSLAPLQPVPAPNGTNISVVCEGPPRTGTFCLYRGGPEGVVRQRWVPGGGSVPFVLGPLHPRDEGAYVCTYSPEGEGVSAPSTELLILVEGGGATPKTPNWPGCEHWEGS